MTRIPNAEEMETLEALVDHTSLFEVVVALSVVCGDKAGHIRASAIQP